MIIGSRRGKKRWPWLLLIFFLLLGGYFSTRAVLFCSTPAEKEGREIVIQVPGGTSLVTAAGLLEESGIIRSVRTFVFLVKLRGRANRIQAGELLFRTDMTPVQVMDVLTRGKAVTYQVTIPEGFNMEQIITVLVSKDLGDREIFRELSRDAQWCQSLGLPGETLEGFLFPDTYSWPRGFSEKEILGQMVAHFKRVFSEKMRERARELGMTELEVVTLASIIEKETGVPEERTLVSSVFHNRLKKGYRLQTDPSVIYGLKDFDGNLTREHLRKDHPYNTYTRSGLPPGPIANPGEASLNAALYPAETFFLYFVARGDGTHVFSKTLIEHNEAVRLFQLGGER